MESNSRPVRESHVVMTQMVLPNDTNQLGNLLGGQLMHWMDLAAAIAAARHTRRVCVTASVDQVNFIHPVRQGEVVMIHASVNRAFHTSMEVGVKVYAEDLRTGDVRHANSAYMTFVAIDDDRHPVTVPAVLAESPDEQRRYADALRRREERLKHRTPAG